MLSEFNDAMSYQTYVNQLGDYVTLHRLHYNKFTISEDVISQIDQFSEVKILVITEPWCGDSLALLPIIRKMAEINGQWEIKILLRDKNIVLMDKFLSNGARAIPIFLFLNMSGELLFRWGPRPKETINIYEKYRELIKEGKIEKQDVIKKIRTYYAKDKGITTVHELLRVFKDHKL